MSGDYRTFQYSKDLRLKYLKERKKSSKEIVKMRDTVNTT